MKKLKEVKTLESRSVLEALVFQVVYILTAEQQNKKTKAFFIVVFILTFACALQVMKLK